jgi:hypothetical protein
MSLFVKGERLTHVSQGGIRCNGRVVDVHDDAGNVYYSVLLDDGREVNTTENRLRKGRFVFVVVVVLVVVVVGKFAMFLKIQGITRRKR